MLNYLTLIYPLEVLVNIRRNTVKTGLLASLALASWVGAQTAPAAVAPEAAPAPTEATAPIVAPAPEAAPAPIVAPAPVANTVVPEAPQAAPAPVAQTPAAPAPVAVAPAPEAKPALEKKPAPSSKPSSISANVTAPAPKAAEKKSDFAIVDVPANFELQAKKVMYKHSEEDPGNNLDQWWGRANLIVNTESEGFKGRVHLRMYPGDLSNNTVVTSVDSTTGKTSSKFIDQFRLEEAWAWQKGEFVNFKLGRWDDNSNVRPNSFYFGGYIDGYNTGFMGTKGPENMVQFGVTANENMSLDLSLISSDANLNKGDLRALFKFQNLTGIEKLNVRIGYRTNVFDEIHESDGDVTHNIDLGFGLPVSSAITLFAEAGMIKLDNQKGDSVAADNGGTLDPQIPILGGLDIRPSKGLNRIVIEAEWADVPEESSKDAIRVNKEVLSSLMIQKKLTDRYTLTGALHNNGLFKDPTFTARLQGRIN